MNTIILQVELRLFKLVLQNPVRVEPNNIGLHCNSSSMPVNGFQVLARCRGYSPCCPDQNNPAPARMGSAHVAYCTVQVRFEAPCPKTGTRAWMGVVAPHPNCDILIVRDATLVDESTNLVHIHCFETERGGVRNPESAFLGYQPGLQVSCSCFLLGLPTI